MSRFAPALATLALLGTAALAADTARPPAPVVPPVNDAVAEDVAVIDTPLGRIVWRFLPDVAPNHVAYVKELIRRGFYDGTTFHRVIPHFVVQGGDPNSKLPDRRLHGEGEADRRLKAEFSALHYRPGTVGMARDADPDSGSCQYFIALEDLPRLDGKYTIFAETIEGLDVARRIADVPRDERDEPLAPIAVKVHMERRNVVAPVHSKEAGGTGEVLTGPGRPRWFDPRDPHWQAPALIAPAPPVESSRSRDPAHGGLVARPASRLDVAVDREGRVLDVRFVDVNTPRAAALLAAARGWSFRPALYDGAPQPVRFEIGADGRNVGACTGGGAPVEADAAGVTAPAAPTITVPLPQGHAAPAPLRVRLTVGPDGKVADAALLGSTGDAALDAAVLDRAKQIVLTPATRPGVKEPEPVSVRLEAPVSFVAP